MTDVAALKKLEFHDHLDGSLRPQTVWELGNRAGIPLAQLTGIEKPTPEKLADWLKGAAHSRSLNEFLNRFPVTCAVLQTEEALFRAAKEAVEDWAAVNVVYGELRFAPENHGIGGLSPEAAVEAVAAGLKAGTEATGTEAGLILCAMRQFGRSKEIAELCLRRRDLVCGFDLAGPERGYPASKHSEAFALLAAAGFESITCHAGEDDGSEAVEAALKAGARRIGHGVAAAAGLKPLRQRLRSHLIECCITSNEATQAVPDVRHHPAAFFRKEGIPVLLCCDDRLMCATDLNREYGRAAQLFGWTEKDFNAMNRRALDFAFGLSPEKKESLKKLFEP